MPDDLKNNPYRAMGAETWAKGARLGMGVFAVFILGAVLTFGGLSLITDMDATNRVFWAILVGPVVSFVLMAAIYVYRLPRLEEDDDDQPESASAESPEDPAT